MGEPRWWQCQNPSWRFPEVVEPICYLRLDHFGVRQILGYLDDTRRTKPTSIWLLIVSDGPPKSRHLAGRCETVYQLALEGLLTFFGGRLALDLCT